MSIYTGSDVTGDLSLSCDVCVVGSGAGGAHVAERLATAGKKVIVLEEGGYHTSDEFNLNEADMLPMLYQDRANRGTMDLSIVIAQGKAVGGTTVVNWTTSFRTPPHVLDYWAEHHGVEGITLEALNPHWDRVEARLNISEVPRENVNRNNQVLWRGAEKLGWEPYLLKRNVKGCAHLGYCGMGCAIDAKQSMLITLIPDAVRAGADLFANCWVERIEASGRKVSKVVGRVQDPSGKPTGHTITVESKLVVLSGGGINNPALLLRSKLGNSSGRVGKRTFLHPAKGMSGFFEERIEGFYGSPQSVAVHKFAQREGKMGFFIEVAPTHPMFTGNFAPGLGKVLRDSMDRHAYRNIVGAILIDGFDPADFDEGGTVGIRENGRPKLDYKWTPRLVEALKEGCKRSAEIQFAAGAQEVHSFHFAEPVVLKSADEIKKLDDAPWGPNHQLVFSAHVMGGCAMGKDPQKSVVDSNLKHHEFDNLFVVDGSVFPTSLGVNPQLSIYGLSSWAAEHVKAAAG